MKPSMQKQNFCMLSPHSSVDRMFPCGGNDRGSNPRGGVEPKGSYLQKA